MKRYSAIFYICLFLCVCTIGDAYPIDDGFQEAKKVEGKNVLLYYMPDLGIDLLIRQLDYVPVNEIVTGVKLSAPTAEGRLAQMLDTLFLEVCDITDMPLYSLQVTIKVCRSYRHLNAVYYTINGVNDPKGRRSFYDYKSNTIYISPDSFTFTVVGHELGHAISSHYFSVPPSPKIQDVLALYVEFTLEKAGRYRALADTQDQGS